MSVFFMWILIRASTYICCSFPVHASCTSSSINFSVNTIIVLIQPLNATLGSCSISGSSQTTSQIYKTSPCFVFWFSISEFPMHGITLLEDLLRQEKKTCSTWTDTRDVHHRAGFNFLMNKIKKYLMVIVNALYSLSDGILVFTWFFINKFPINFSCLSLSFSLRVC